VRVTKTETGAVRSVSTDGSGAYDVPGLTPREYSIEVEAKGFAIGTRNTRLEVGQSMRMDMTLGLGTAKQKLTVSANVETLKTDDTSIGEVVESVAVQQLPLNGLMLLDMAPTAPGSHMSHGATTPETGCRSCNCAGSGDNVCACAT
jgi:Carboxypeptidase regulatory-like domain